ncbi:MAG: hypothetical protein K940chlam6_00540 [Chlamydiae bacterium]|nr:hypothetical protein [Chlamydiota bacterium]
MMLSISQLHASYEDLKVYASDKVEKTLAFGKEHKREILLAAGVVATAVLVYYFVLPQLFPPATDKFADLGKSVVKKNPIIPKSSISDQSFNPKTLPSLVNQGQRVLNEGTCPAFDLPAPLLAIADKPHNSELPSFPTTEQTNSMDKMPIPLIEQPISPKLGPNIFEKIKKTTAESFSNEDRSEEYITRELLAAGFSRSCEKMKGAFETSQYYAEKMRIVSQPIATWAFRIALPFLIKDLIFNKGRIFI